MTEIILKPDIQTSVSVQFGAYTLSIHVFLPSFIHIQCRPKSGTLFNYANIHTCTCLIFGVSISLGLDPIARNAQKEFFDRSHRWEENKHSIKLSNVNKLAVSKLVLPYNVSMGAGNMRAGSRSHSTYRRPSLDGF